MTGDHQPSHSSTNLTQRLDIDFALQAAGLGVWEYDPTSNQVLWDDRCRALFGLAVNNHMSYQQAFEYIHPDDVTRVDQAARWVMNPESDGIFDQTYRTIGVDDETLRWVRFQGRVDFTPTGQVARFAGVAQEVTPQILAQQKLVESEARFRSLIEEAPVATCLLVGRELHIEVINEAMIGLFGKGPSVLGKPLAMALPELADQPFLGLLDEIFTSGQLYETRATPARMVIDGVLGTYYYDATFKPLRNADGQVYAILEMGIDVTQQVLARQKIEESEARLQLLTNTVPAMIFSLDQQQRYQSYNNTFMDWFGVDATQVLGQTVREFLGEAGYSAALPYLTTAYAGQPVRYQLQAPSRLDSTRWLDIVYSPLTNAAGQVTDLIVHATDITPLKQTELALTESESRFRSLAQSLEQQVQERTEELAASNEELTSSNQDIIASNQALEVANTDLTRSNQNLEQFAYIASHDLQEPLRKIQQFGDLLQGQYGEQLGEGKAYLERMQVAAARMSLLIKDLLTFSRIATTQVDAQPVSLTQVVNQVTENLSVVIEESGAQIQIDALPIVPGDALQLGQLFQNLLSNALKFRRTSLMGEILIPSVTIKARLLPRYELPALLHPTRYAETYHLIEVIDNGIGFDEKYKDRIFQVFQRLHGKNEFAGTGVGLAIVQKVVTNHGGAITASSKPGQGATFCVYLPA